jgi:hypothetical protein
LTLAAESQVIQLAGIPTQEAFGNIDVTVGPGKADGLVRFFISVVTESRTFVRDVLVAVTAGGILLYCQSLTHHKDFIEYIKSRN